MKTKDVLSKAIRLIVRMEERYKSSLSALDHCTNVDERFLNEVIEIEEDLRVLKSRESFLTFQSKTGMLYTGIDLNRFEKYL